MSKNPILGDFGHFGEKPPKKGQKPRNFGVFFDVSVWANGGGGMSVLAIFVVNLINVLFFAQKPVWPTLDRETILTIFFGLFGGKIPTFTSGALRFSCTFRYQILPNRLFGVPNQNFCSKKLGFLPCFLNFTEIYRKNSQVCRVGLPTLSLS